MLQLVGVGHDGVEVASRHPDDLDARAHQPSEGRQAAGHQLIQVQHSRREHLAAAEGQQLAGQARGAIGGALDLDEVLPGQGRKPRLFLQQRDVSDDAREQVVEVVRDAAGELTDGLRALGAAQALLELAALGHVGGDPHDSDKYAVPAEPRRPDVEQPAVLPVMTPHPELGLERGLPRDGGLDLRQRGRAVFRMKPVGPTVAELRHRLPAGELEPAGVDVVAGAFGGECPHHGRQAR